MALASNLLVTGDGNNGTPRSVLCHKMGGVSSSSQRNDGSRLALKCGLNSSNRHSVSRISRCHDLKYFINSIELST